MAQTSPRANPDETLSDILADDDAVEQLPPIRVKEAWVKIKLFEVAREEYLRPRYGKRSQTNDEYDRLMRYLEKWGLQGIQVALRSFAGKAFAHGFVGEVCPGETSEAAAEITVENIFAKITKTDVPEHRRVEIIRDKLKTTLRSCGTPRSKIARAVVQDWKAERADQEGQ